LALICSGCATKHDLFLHEGRLYCRACLPLIELPFHVRLTCAIQAAQENCRDARRLHAKRQQTR
jgi:hypothetical protein